MIYNILFLEELIPNLNLQSKSVWVCNACFFFITSDTISSGNWNEEWKVQASIFATAEGIIITTMISSLLLWTILGNLEKIKKFAVKSHCTKTKTCCRLQKGFHLQEVISNSASQRSMVVCQSYLSLKKVLFGSTINFFLCIWSFWYSHTLPVLCLKIDTGVSIKYLYLAIWWAIYWQLK